MRPSPTSSIPSSVISKVEIRGSDLMQSGNEVLTGKDINQSKQCESKRNEFYSIYFWRPRFFMYLFACFCKGLSSIFSSVKLDLSFSIRLSPTFDPQISGNSSSEKNRPWLRKKLGCGIEHFPLGKTGG